MQAPPTPEGEQRKPAAHRWKPEVKKRVLLLIRIQEVFSEEKRKDGAFFSSLNNIFSRK